MGRLERGGSGLLVEGKLEGSLVVCLMDTGASVNLLSLSWWRTHGEPGRLEDTKEMVYSVEGRPMRLHGRVRGTVTMGGRAWPVVFELTDIPTDAILGTCFLLETRYTVDLARERLVLEDPPEEEERVHVCRVVSCGTAVIGAGEEKVVDGYLVGDWYGEEEGLVEGLREVEDSRGLLVGRGLIDVGASTTPVRIFNPGQDPVIVYRDMTLASLEPVIGSEPPDPPGDGARCRVVGKGEATAQPSREETDRVVAVLTEGVEPEKQQALEELLRRHKGAFQLRPGDTGRANTVQHKIDTGDHPPVRLPPRR